MRLQLQNNAITTLAQLLVHCVETAECDCTMTRTRTHTHTLTCRTFTVIERWRDADTHATIVARIFETLIN